MFDNRTSFSSSIFYLQNYPLHCNSTNTKHTQLSFHKHRQTKEEMNEIKALREESERLGREREQIEDRLKKFDSQRFLKGRRNFTRGGGGRNEREGRRGERGEINEGNRPNKRVRNEENEIKPQQQPRLLSSIAVVKSSSTTSISTNSTNDRWNSNTTTTSNHTPNIIHNNNNSDNYNEQENETETASKPLQEAYMKPMTIQRNKRMFSALMGHLSSAQKNLERDSSQIEKQDTRKTLASQKNTLESQRVAELHKVVTREQKDKVIN